RFGVKRSACAHHAQRPTPNAQPPHHGGAAAVIAATQRRGHRSASEVTRHAPRQTLNAIRSTSARRQRGHP
ncbi:MAG: hypothetical protein M0Q87_12605, partial [Ottowia sp.]|nr:hypothetical protein [Ottowia sp.]